MSDPRAATEGATGISMDLGPDAGWRKGEPVSLAQVRAAQIRDGDAIWYDIGQEFKVVVGRKLERVAGTDRVALYLDEGPDETLSVSFSLGEFVLCAALSESTPPADTQHPDPPTKGTMKVRMGLRHDNDAWVTARSDESATVYRVYRVDPTLPEYGVDDYGVALVSGPDVLDHAEVRRCAHDAFLDAFGPL